MLRTSERRQSDITVHVVQKTEGPSLDISGGGLCLLSAEPFREGAKVELSFSFLDAEEKTVKCECEAKVAWCRTSKLDPEMWEVGFNFDGIDEAVREKIIKFVDARLAKVGN